MHLKDKIILITGSSTGIGRATAELCIKEGARVMIHGLNEEETKATASDLAQPYIVADLSQADAAQTLIDTTLTYYGQLDGLVNNAASVKRATLEETNAETFDFFMALNLRAPLLLIRAAMPHFKKQTNATVVNIGSVNAYCGNPNLLPYSISKGGLMTLTRNLANVYSKDKVRINQLNLGWVTSENEIALQISEGQAPDWHLTMDIDRAPTGKLLAPADVAKQIVFWLSDASAPVTGAIYEVEQYPVLGRRPPDFKTD